VTSTVTVTVTVAVAAAINMEERTIILVIAVIMHITITANTASCTMTGSRCIPTVPLVIMAMMTVIKNMLVLSMLLSMVLLRMVLVVALAVAVTVVVVVLMMRGPQAGSGRPAGPEDQAVEHLGARVRGRVVRLAGGPVRAAAASTSRAIVTGIVSGHRGRGRGRGR
jgi:hypothetical protein